MSSLNVINYPSGIGAYKVTWGLKRFDSVFQSPLGGNIQVVRRGARWTAQIDYQNLTNDDAATLRAFLAQMADFGNACYFTDPGYKARGALGGSPTFTSLGSDTNHIVTGGWPVSTAILKAGDLLGLATGQLVSVAADVTSDSSGNATIQIAPEVRSTPTGGSAITTSAPTVVMGLSNPTFASTRTAPVLSDLSIQLVERIQ